MTSVGVNDLPPSCTVAFLYQILPSFFHTCTQKEKAGNKTKRMPTRNGGEPFALGEVTHWFANELIKQYQKNLRKKPKLTINHFSRAIEIVAWMLIVVS